jgi:hypothetical protein
MLYSIHKYLIWDLQIIQTIQIISSHKLPIALMLIFGILHLISYKKDNFHEKIEKLSLRYWTLFLILVMVLIIFLYDGDPEQFIYFKF